MPELMHAKMRIFRAALAVALALGAAPAQAQSIVPATPSPEPTVSSSPAPASSPAPVVPAGVVPADVSVALAGTVTPRFALARVRAAIDALAARQPGTLLDVHGITLNGNLAPGTTLDALAGVTIAGRGAFLDVQGKTNVHVTVADLPPFQPQLLFYSDDPEYVPPADDGVLFRATIAPDVPARLFLYHVAATAPRRFGLVFRTSGVAAQIEVVGTAVGPSPQYAYVGQQTTARFLTEAALPEGVLLDVAPGVPLELPLGALQPGDLIEAIEDMRVVSGGPVNVALVTTASDVSLASLADGPQLPGDSHDRRGIYSLAAIAPIDLSLSTDGSEPDPFSVGMTPLANELPGGRILAGDYGIARRIVLHLANPTDRAQTVYLDERTLGGGGATVTMLFDGDDAPTLVPCVNDPNQPRLVRAFDLAAGATEVVNGTYMTDGASSYPIAFGLTLTPPLPVPPGACNGAPQN
jgi:hypothetical protein